MAQDTARQTILTAVRAAKPTAIPRPVVRDIVRGFHRTPHDCVQRFMEAARDAGAEILEGDRRLIVDIVSDTPDTIICEAVLGVAENGAVWLPGSQVKDRAALFLAEQVIVILRRSMIVDDLHMAYTRIDVTCDAFGVFMAGPSKTADIEQALVIGAHGPKRLTLLLVGEV